MRWFVATFLLSENTTLPGSRKSQHRISGSYACTKSFNQRVYDLIISAYKWVKSDGQNIFCELGRRWACFTFMPHQINNNNLKTSKAAGFPVTAPAPSHPDSCHAHSHLPYKALDSTNVNQFLNETLQSHRLNTQSPVTESVWSFKQSKISTSRSFLCMLPHSSVCACVHLAPSCVQVVAVGGEEQMGEASVVAGR